jgi:hypothetical protein
MDSTTGGVVVSSTGLMGEFTVTVDDPDQLLFQRVDLASQ